MKGSGGRTDKVLFQTREDCVADRHVDDYRVKLPVLPCTLCDQKEIDNKNSATLKQFNEKAGSGETF